MTTSDRVQDFSMPVWRIRRSRRWRALAALPFLLVPLAIISAIATGNAQNLMLVAHGLAFGAFAQYFAWHKNPSPSIEPGVATVAGHVLSVGGTSWSVSHFTRGVIIGSQRGPVVRLFRGKRHFPIDLGVRTEEEGKRLLEALGLAGHQSVASFRGLSKAQLLPPWKMGLAMVACMVLGGFFGIQVQSMVSGSFPYFIVTIMLAMAPMMVYLAAPTTIDVGADGVRLRWLGRDTFIPITDIARVDVQQVAIHRQGQMRMTIERHNADPVMVALGNAQTDFGQAEAVAARIRWVMEARGKGSEATAQLRRDRPLRAWVERLRGLDRQATHRVAPVSRQALWSTLEDVRSAPLDRAAAAVALREELAPEERRRLEMAARATAAPRLRVALERAIDDDDAALVEALAELEAMQAEDERAAR